MNSLRTYRSEESTCVPLGYPISYRVAIRYPAVESDVSAAGFDITSDTFAYIESVFIFSFLETNILYKRTNCRYVSEISKLEDSNIRERHCFEDCIILKNVYTAYATFVLIRLG